MKSAVAVRDRPQGQQEVFGSGLDETAPHPQHSFARARFPESGFTGRKNDEPRSRKIESRHLLGGEDSVIGGVEDASFAPLLQRRLGSGEIVGGPVRRELFPQSRDIRLHLGLSRRECDGEDRGE